MSKKSKFIKATKLTVASVVLTAGLSSCGLMSGKHNCMFKGDKTKAEKSSCAMKNGKMKCATDKKGKMKCATDKKGKMKCSTKNGKANCASKKSK